MPVDGKLLEILCCPVSRTPLTRLEASRLERLNREIEAGKALFIGGEPGEVGAGLGEGAAHQEPFAKLSLPAEHPREPGCCKRPGRNIRDGSSRNRYFANASSRTGPEGENSVA